MAKLVGASPEMPYEDRKLRLVENGIALWDVLDSGYRSGSLDSAIRQSVPNNFITFFDAHPGIDLICFNGKKAAKIYETKVLPTLRDRKREISRRVLPATSPAFAAMRFNQKLSSWCIVLRKNFTS